MMAFHRINYVSCDGCRKNNLQKSVEFEEITTPIGKVIHICEYCIEEEKYYCQLCQKIHSDEKPCKQQLQAVQ